MKFFNEIIFAILFVGYKLYLQKQSTTIETEVEDQSLKNILKDAIIESYERYEIPVPNDNILAWFTANYFNYCNFLNAPLSEVTVIEVIGLYIQIKLLDRILNKISTIVSGKK